MVLGSHLIFTAYGYWLPNDLRGSTSHIIRSDIIADLGALHFGRKQIQPAARDLRAFFTRASAVLKFPLLEFDAADRAIMAAAFARVIAERRYTCYACAFMPDHTHVLMRKHRDCAEEMIEALQDESRCALPVTEVRFADHPVWGGPGWKVFQDTPEDIWRTIRYIEENPIRARMAAQKWDFVTPYDNWPFHKRIRGQV